MRYVHVGTKSELEDALFVPSVEEMDCIVEVESSINANAIVHRLFGLLFYFGFYMSSLLVHFVDIEYSFTALWRGLHAKLQKNPWALSRPVFFIR